MQLDFDSVLIEPVLTEKTNEIRDENKFVFKVDARATKIQVKEAVRRIFNVHPVSCNIINVGGKPKKLRSRSGYTASWKKAIVRLKAGETIKVFEGV